MAFRVGDIVRSEAYGPNGSTLVLLAFGRFWTALIVESHVTHRDDYLNEGKIILIGLPGEWKKLSSSC